MTCSRDAVAAELAELLGATAFDDPWSDEPNSTSRMRHSDGVLYTAARLRFHEQLVESRRATAATIEEVPAAVVTAGPPGAGKSTALAADEKLVGYRNVDADDFKDALLEEAKRDGLLDGWLSRRLCDERAVSLRELAGYVHAESTAVADAMLERSLEARESIVIHGTLSSTEYVEDLLSELDDFGYERLIIVDVDVSAEQAVERALDRWWRVRDAEDERLGGRFVPPAGIRAYYQESSASAVTKANAIALRDRSAALGWQVELRTVTP